MKSKEIYIYSDQPLKSMSTYFLRDTTANFPYLGHFVF